MRPFHTYLAISLPCWLFLVWAAFSFQLSAYLPGTDIWEHAAALTQWLSDLAAPSSPHVASNEGSARYMPYYFLVASLARVFGLDAFGALGIAGVLSSTLFFVSVWLFAHRYYQRRWSGPILLIVLLAGWGVPWLWSNVYQLRVLLYVQSYPSFFAFALGLLTLWTGLGILQLQAGRPARAIAVALLVTIMFASHPLTGAFMIGALVLLALLHDKGDLRSRCFLVLAVVIGSMLVELWPFFSTWQVVLGVRPSSSGTWLANLEPGPFTRTGDLYRNHSFYQPLRITVALGPALLALPALAVYVSRRQELFAAAGAVLMSVPYLANLVVGIPLGHRFLLFAMFFLHLILARYLLDVLDARFLDIFNSRRAIARTIVPALLALLVGWNLALLGLELTGLALRKDGTLMAVDRSARVDEQLRSVAIAVCDEDVVMATRLSGWPLPSIVGKVVAPLHPNPLIADLRARTDDVHRFFSAETNNLERVTLLEKYGARRILFLESELPALVRDDLLELASDALAKNGYVLLSLPGVRGCVP